MEFIVNKSITILSLLELWQFFDNYMDILKIKLLHMNYKLISILCLFSIIKPHILMLKLN